MKQGSELCDYVSNNSKARLPPLFLYKSTIPLWIKNGLKKNKAQNYKCTDCKKQFQHEYLYWGADISIKRQIIRMLVHGSGITDVAKVLGVSKGCIIRTMLKIGMGITLKPSKKHYHKVQIDKLHSFVSKKRKKVWIIYAYDAETDEIIAVTAGKRSKKQVKDLYKRLEGITIDWFCTGTRSPINGKLLDKYFHMINI